MLEQRNARRLLSVVSGLWLLGVCSALYAQTSIRAITRPSADITLSFVQPGRVAEVHVKEGHAVSAGQLLVQEDDAVERAQLAQLKAQSDNLTQIHASEASLAQRQVDLEKLQMAAERNAATPLEVQHAQLEVKIAELSLELARFEHEQATRKYEEHKIRVEQMQLPSPIDGRIERVEVEAGESVSALADVVQVVQIDPLWIDVPVPLHRAMDLERDMAAQVVFSGPKEVAVAGRITFVAAVADAASDTVRVRVEVPNKTGRPAGEHVTVAFPVSQ
jgi:multidrug efflux system membrane fusion protein